MHKIILLSLFVIVLLPVPSSANSYEANEIIEFENWADENNIALVGVNKNSYDLYYDGFNPKTDFVNWKEIPNVLIVADALYLIPEDVMQVMDGKTIYLSTEHGRSYAVLGSFPEYGILEGLNRGIILEQNFNSHTVIHELGHIVDYHGIQGMYDDEHNLFESSLDDRNFIFRGMTNSSESQTPNGYISLYSTVNDAENFAENFAYYVIYPNEFRDRLETDPLLIDEYEFMRDMIFSSFEYN
ncbi:hypothetical protein [Nitrosopumilus sp.]|uniref:putative zinc-binding metallopeptidase n=1 Tax=Nitrosopumilus sp. TaxID=2024843 RepID=UPI0026079B45|nr:hypothetical protein [Nitrosopumilus sp.]